ncbi:MAG: response regulator [Desulfovibrio sp.]|jgi:CheY-like chemotaxis protein|nr:response regulator [Desulfovibrio sp.]
MNSPISVLVIDDDLSVCAAIKRGLEKTHQYIVHIASSGPEGVQTACERLPDVILLDMMMPQMTGAEVARMLRDNQQTADIPYIYLTGLLTRREAEAFCGVIDGERYLPKPANLDEIVAVIDSVLSMRKNHRKLAE